MLQPTGPQSAAERPPPLLPAVPNTLKLLATWLPPQSGQVIVSCEFIERMNCSKFVLQSLQ